jgi:O-antigen ligase
MTLPESEAGTVLGVHNTFLAYLVELGIGGFLLYSLITAIVYTNGLSVYLSNRKGALTSGMLLIGIVSFHAYSSLTLMYQQPSVMMIYWLVTGAAVVYFADMY